MDALEARAVAATGRDRDTTHSLRLALLDRMLREAEAAAREHRAAE